ncbi:MAG: glycosyltransferase family 4 protein [Campylobacterales bacterium]|nr:glycosyltransferase family 4 protein [Campylobacterales bacterium]
MKQKKVLIAIPCLQLGGTEYQTLNLVRALIETNYKVDVLCYFEYDDHMVKYMQLAGAEVFLMSHNGHRPTTLKEKVFFLYKGFKQNLIISKPDVVHVQYMNPGSIAIILFKILGVQKILATAHVPGHIYKNKFIPQFLTKYILEAFLCVSQASEKAFFDTDAKIFTPESLQNGRKHFTIYNCIDIDNTKIIAKQDNSFTLGVVSRLSPEKGIDVMLHAMTHLVKHFENIRLLIVGDGKSRDTLHELAKDLNIKNNIEWVGLQPKENLKSFYQQMDIVVIPSRFEGFGLTAIEAMNYNIPVIASNVDGLTEVIEDNISGVLFPCEDSNELEKAIINLLNSSNKRHQLAQNAHKRVIQYFSYNSYKEKISQLYSEVLKERA